MFSKNIKLSLIAQGVGEETAVKFFKIAVESVKKGVSKSQNDFKNDPEQYAFRSAKSSWFNWSIKKLFIRSVLLDENLRTKVRHLKSHGVDYFVLEGKAIVCFKKMDIKSRVSSFYSKRFKDLISGKAVHYSKAMLDNLAKMGVNKPLPIYFAGYVLDYANRLSDIRLVFYQDNAVAYEKSLMKLFETSLFDSDIEQTQETNDVLVTLKNKDAAKKKSS